MISYPISPFCVPIVLLLWTIDAYAFAIVARVILMRLNITRNATATLALREIVDPLAEVVKRWMRAGTHRPVRSWVPWTVLFGGILVARYLIVLLLFWIAK